MDKRYSKASVFEKLPDWIVKSGSCHSELQSGVCQSFGFKKESLVERMTATGFGPAMSEVGKFFRSKKKVS